MHHHQGQRTTSIKTNLFICGQSLITPASATGGVLLLFTTAELYLDRLYKGGERKYRTHCVPNGLYRAVVMLRIIIASLTILHSKYNSNQGLSDDALTDQRNNHLGHCRCWRYQYAINGVEISCGFGPHVGHTIAVGIQRLRSVQLKGCLWTILTRSRTIGGGLFTRSTHRNGFIFTRIGNGPIVLCNVTRCMDNVRCGPKTPSYTGVVNAGTRNIQ